MRGDLLGVRAALPLFFTVAASQEPCLFWGRHGRQGKVQRGLHCPMSVFPLLIPRRLWWTYSLAAPWPQFLLLVLLSALKKRKTEVAPAVA